MTISVGDVVRRKTHPRENDPNGLGVVMELNSGVFEDQIKVLWNTPTWYDPADGLSAEYREEIEVVSRRKVKQE